MYVEFLPRQPVLQRKKRVLTIATTPTKIPMSTDDEQVDSDIDALLSPPLGVIGVKSPSFAPRKTLILSSTSRRDPKLVTSPLKSPLRISVIPSPSTDGINSEVAELLEGTVLSHDYSSGSQDDRFEDEVGDTVNTLDSGSDSVWELYASKICQEDLPRLGLVELDQEFQDSPFEWRMAEELWASHRTDYSHDTEFKGSSPEPVPDWFSPTLDSSPPCELQPIQFFNKMFPLETMWMVVRETNRYAVLKFGDKWHALTVTEFCLWLGSALYMTRARRPDR
ncbi:hypothetical protein R1sor_024225 [Riccia sorocarpa]|uniref:Uncharacterized protein n=1 Tax=Riccia sorocarpa TaxID=122646 RepID=A0ABD3GS98_9MARC